MPNPTKESGRRVDEIWIDYIVRLEAERDALREALNEPNFVIAGPNGDDWFVYRESRIRAALAQEQGE